MYSAEKRRTSGWVPDPTGAAMLATRNPEKPRRGLGSGTELALWLFETVLSGGKRTGFPPLGGPQDVPAALSAALKDLRNRRIWEGGSLLPLPAMVPWMETATATLRNLVYRGVVSETVRLSGYEDARDAMVAGYAVVGGATRLPGHQRDKFGYCTPTEVHPNYAYYRGVSDNPKRPALVRQLFWGDAVPAGPSRVRLPHGVWWDLPPGCFFLDAEYVDGDELWAIR